MHTWMQFTFSLVDCVSGIWPRVDGHLQPLYNILCAALKCAYAYIQRSLTTFNVLSTWRFCLQHTHYTLYYHYYSAATARLRWYQVVFFSIFWFQNDVGILVYGKKIIRGLHTGIYYYVSVMRTCIYTVCTIRIIYYEHVVYLKYPATTERRRSNGMDEKKSPKSNGGIFSFTCPPTRSNFWYTHLSLSCQLRGLLIIFHHYSYTYSRGYDVFFFLGFLGGYRRIIYIYIYLYERKINKY